MNEKVATWRGIYVATALPFKQDESIDFDAYSEHVAWLAKSGMDGVTPNGSLGEYQNLSAADRARVVETAIAAAPAGFGVMPGVAAYGSLDSVRWIEQAAKAGAKSVLLLPPNTFRANRAAIIDHYRDAAHVGLPIVAYNNPHDTKIDLTPDLLAELHGEGLIVAVKEFSGDPRRGYEIKELAPGLDLLIGADDVVLELSLIGAVGWISGFTNSLPVICRRLYDLSTSDKGDDVLEAAGIYRQLHSLLRWDSKVDFVQAIKYSMDVAEQPGGGACLPPRAELSAEAKAEIARGTRIGLELTAALDSGTGSSY